MPQQIDRDKLVRLHALTALVTPSHKTTTTYILWGNLTHLVAKLREIHNDKYSYKEFQKMATKLLEQRDQLLEEFQYKCYAIVDKQIVGPFSHPTHCVVNRKGKLTIRESRDLQKHLDISNREFEIRNNK